MLRVSYRYKVTTYLRMFSAVSLTFLFLLMILWNKQKYSTNNVKNPIHHPAVWKRSGRQLPNLSQGLFVTTPLTITIAGTFYKKVTLPTLLFNLWEWPQTKTRDKGVYSKLNRWVVYRVLHCLSIVPSLHYRKYHPLTLCCWTDTFYG